MLLTQALADAGPEQLIMLVSYGDGSDVLAFRTTSAVGRPPPKGMGQKGMGQKGMGQKGMGLKGHLESKRVLESYEVYARWREVWPTDDAARRPAPASPSVTALWREEEKNLRFHGEKCNSCGYIQYPPQRVCVNCQGAGRCLAGAPERTGWHGLHLLHGLYCRRHRHSPGDCRGGF